MTDSLKVVLNKKHSLVLRIFSFVRITARITFTILYPQSQCIHVIYIIYTSHSPYNRYELNLLLTCLLRQCFVAQLVEHRTVIVKVIGWNIYVCVRTTASVWRWSLIRVLTRLTRLTVTSELVCLTSLFLAKILLSNTTLTSLRFSTPSVFPLPSLCELLWISYF